MINVSDEFSNFKYINVETLEQKIGIIPDDMKNAIDLYNKAIEDIESKNEDMAIIALKKAISIYPAFYEAMNLMGVCYFAQNQEESARNIFKKVIKMDDSSIKASRYLDQLDGITSKDETRGKSFKSKNKTNKMNSIAAWAMRGLAKEHNPYYLKYVLGIIIGVLLMCFIWLIIPINKPIVIDFKGLLNKPTDQTETVKELQSEIISVNTRLEEANAALSKARETEKLLQDQMDQYVKGSAILRDLQNLADAGKYRDVVIEIEKNLVGLVLPDDIEKEIIALNNSCKPKAVKQFYDSAKKIYDSNSNAKALDIYQQAAKEYSMGISIMEELQEKPSYIAEIYYYGGKAIALSESPTKEEAIAEAIRCFDQVVANTPGSKLASYALGRINDINAGRAIRH